MDCHNNDTKGGVGVAAELLRVAADLPPNCRHMMSMMGGQGMRDADGKKQYCGCKKETCRTKQCVCFVAQRLCGSRCHGGHNPKCQNNTND